MATNVSPTDAADDVAPQADAFDLDGGRPWYASRRIGAAVLIGAALIGEGVWMAQARDPLAAQRKAVAALDDATKAELVERWERYRKLSPDEQQRLRDLHAAIDADADPGRLRATLASYQQWKSGLSPVQSAELLGLDASARLQRVRAIADEQTAAAARHLSDDDAKKIVAWLERQIDSVQDKLLDALPPDTRKRFESYDRRQRNWSLIMSLVSFRAAGGPPIGPKLENLSPAALAELHDDLSPAAQRVWDSAKSPDERKQLLGDWIRQAVFRSMPHREGYGVRIDEDQLRNFVEHELTDAERARYSALPREEMNSQLRREYLRRKGLWKEPNFGDGPWGRGPYGRGSFGSGGPGERRSPQGPPGGPRNGLPPGDGPRETAPNSPPGGNR